MTSAIPAALKLLTIISVWRFVNDDTNLQLFGMQGFYHRKEKGTFTSGGVLPFLSCFETSFVI